MKNILRLVILGVVFSLSTAYAVDRSRNAGSVSPTTGDNILFTKVTLSSTTASSLGAYSSGRGALTCINSDSNNAVYIGSSTKVTAGGGASFVLTAGSAIQITNTGEVDAIADAGVSSVVVYCINEN